MIDGAHKTIWLSETEIRQFELIKRAGAPQIQDELPEGYAFDPSEFFPRLYYLLEREEHRLADGGHTNLFYVQWDGMYEVAVLLDERMRPHIVASPAHAKWPNQGVYHFETWLEGTRVFSRSI